MRFRVHSLPPRWLERYSVEWRPSPALIIRRACPATGTHIESHAYAKRPAHHAPGLRTWNPGNDGYTRGDAEEATYGPAFLRRVWHRGRWRWIHSIALLETGTSPRVIAFGTRLRDSSTTAHTRFATPHAGQTPTRSPSPSLPTPSAPSSREEGGTDRRHCGYCCPSHAALIFFSAVTWRTPCRTTTRFGFSQPTFYGTIPPRAMRHATTNALHAAPRCECECASATSPDVRYIVPDVMPRPRSTPRPLAP
ncbi:hypothetical protein B0H19DRAFT_449820 [Mycena capillaripes]|nr:hypothetical protein B0H19DRAFT_449635 [Mycena capillaripes]KAJ6532471.1 hypothetical protein B0H19DRAFT_449820 [Mycena capillaripes]